MSFARIVPKQLAQQVHRMPRDLHAAVCQAGRCTRDCIEVTRVIVCNVREGSGVDWPASGPRATFESAPQILVTMHVSNALQYLSLRAAAGLVLRLKQL